MNHITLKSVTLKYYKNQSNIRNIKDFFLEKKSSITSIVNNKFTALDNINLDLRQNDKLGIVGSNGAGKSSLLKIISRIHKPDEGTVSVNAKVVSLLELGAGFMPELTGRENIQLYCSILGMTKEKIKSIEKEIINFSEIPDFIDTHIKYYSSGMLVRLAFSIVSHIDFDALILDEIFAGGDIGFIEKSSKKLDEMIDKSKILIIVSHDMEHIRKYCNKVLWLYEGKIKLIGPPEEVIKKFEQSFKLT